MKGKIIEIIAHGVVVSIAVFLCMEWFNVEFYKPLILYILFGWALNISNIDKQ